MRLRTIRVERVLPFRFICWLHAMRRSGEEWIEQAMSPACVDNPRWLVEPCCWVDVPAAWMHGSLRGLRCCGWMRLRDSRWLVARDCRGRKHLHLLGLPRTCSKPAWFLLARRLLYTASRTQHAVGQALGELRERCDRIIVITDEQSHDRVPAPSSCRS